MGLFQSSQENGTNTSDNVVSYASQIESFKSLAGDSDAVLLEEFINKINAGGEDGVSPIVLSPDSDKSHRKVSMSFGAYFDHFFLIFVRFRKHLSILARTLILGQSGCLITLGWNFCGSYMVFWLTNQVSNWMLLIHTSFVYLAFF